MARIKWTGRGQVDSSADGTSVYEVVVNDDWVSVYVSKEVAEDRAIGATRAVAEGKISKRRTKQVARYPPGSMSPAPTFADSFAIQ